MAGIGGGNRAAESVTMTPTQAPLRAARVLGLAALLAAGAAAPSAASPLSPQLLRTLSPEALRAIPPEPPLTSARRLAPGLDAAATTGGRRWTGHPRVLVLLVDFADRPADRAAHPSEYYRQLLFSAGELERGSLRDYYREATYGKIDVTGEVHGWFRLPGNYADFTGGESGLCASCFPHNARAVAAAAVTAAADSVDFHRFDDDGPDAAPGSADDDGILDALVIVFPGYGTERTGNLNDFRSHYWTMTSVQSVQGVRVPDYALIPELENVGIAVHEFGHVLGAPDLYDGSGRGTGIGYTSVMAAGIWFDNGRRPGGPDPYTRILWGALTPEAPGADDPGARLPRVNETPYALRLWTRGESGPEYFLVENRAPVGIDRFLPGSGLLVYRVNETARDETDPGRYLVTLLEADGNRNLSGGRPVNNGEASDFFPGPGGVRAIGAGTVPSTRDAAGNPTGVSLAAISDAESVMTVDVSVGRAVGSVPDPVLRLEPASGLYRGAGEAESPALVRVRVENRGARLPAGTFRLLSPGPGVRPRLSATPLGELAPLSARTLDEPVQVDVDPGALGVVAPAPLEATWTTGDGTVYTMAAPLPDGGAVLARSDFETGDGGGVPGSLTLVSGPWSRRKGAAVSGAWAWSTAGYGPRADAVLVFGPYPLPGSAELRFRQRMDTPDHNGYASDGGYLEVSRDSTLWTLAVPEGGYPDVFDLTDGNSYPGRPAFGGPGGGWESVRVPVEGDPGPVWFRFHFVSDFSGNAGLYDGWAVDDVFFRGWRHGVAVAMDPVVPDGGRARIDFRVLAMVSPGTAGTLDLVRIRAGARLVLSRWAYRGDREVSVAIDDPLVPGTEDRFQLEWGEGGGVAAGPLTVLPEAPPPKGILAGTPGVIRRSDGGWIVVEVPGDRPLPGTLDLFDVRGARLARLAEGTWTPGIYRVSWSAAGGRSGIAAGIYFLRATVGDRTGVRRVVLLP